MRAEAERLAAEGFCVFPLQVGTNRPPAGSWYDRLCRTPEAARAMWSGEFANANVAIHCEGLVVIDVDEGKKPGALAAYRALDLPPTYTVATPSGGYHFYFEGPDVKNSVGELAPGIDVRSRGGYVAAPGSVTAKGRYDVLHDLPLALAPRWLVTRCGPPGARADRKEVDWNRSGTPDARMLPAINWLVTEAPPSIEGAGGNAAGYEVAAELHDRGVFAQDALNLLLGHWNARCSPPWSPDELERLITNGYTYSQNAFGCRAPDKVYAGVVIPAPEAPPAVLPLATWSAAEFDDEEVGEEDWFIKGWMPARNVTLLYGDGGVGKSLAAIQLAVATATGTPWLGLQIADPGAVLFVSAEEERAELNRRTRAAVSAYGRCPPDLHYFSLAGEDATMARFGRDEVLQSTPLWQRTLATVEKLKPALVILDNASDMFGGNEVSKLQVRQFMTMLRGAAKRFDMTILLLAHPSQSGMERGTSGNTAWSNSARGRLFMKFEDADLAAFKKGDPDVRTITLMKTNSAQRGATLRVRWQAGRFVPEESDAAREERAVAELAAAVVAVMDKEGWDASHSSLEVAKAVMPHSADLQLIFKQDGKWGSVKTELAKRLAGGVKVGGTVVTIAGDLVVLK